MLLANVVLMAQIASNTPAREVNRPCADPAALCRISPFFCPGAYPKGLEPCWPEGSREPRNVGARGARSGSTQHSAPAAAPTRSTSERTRPAPSKLSRLTAD
jgi:hypothetical protein